MNFFIFNSNFGPTEGEVKLPAESISVRDPQLSTIDIDMILICFDFGLGGLLLGLYVDLY